MLIFLRYTLNDGKSIHNSKPTEGANEIFHLLKKHPKDILKEEKERKPRKSMINGKHKIKL